MPMYSESGSLTPIEGDSPTLGDYPSPHLKLGASRPPNLLFLVMWKRSVWYNPRHIELFIDRSLSTYDGAELTELVLLCHQHHIRLEIDAVMHPKEYEDGVCETSMLRLFFTQRQPQGQFWERHPTLEQAIKHLAKVVE